VKVDAAGRIYIADTLNHKVKRLDPSGTVTTVAGDGVPGRGSDNIAAAESSLNSPAGLAIAPNGDLYIADWQNYLIRKVSFGARPAIASGGIVNAASFAAGALAPGTIVTIVGSNLAGNTVEVNGAPAPLFYVSPNQINAQLPFDLPPGSATLTVRDSSGATAAGTFEVSPTSPGLFQFTEGRAAALNQDGSVNADNNPESIGNVVVVFLTGMGAVNPAIASGDVTPADVLRRPVAPVSATIAGVEAEVLFAGMTPGSIGLAQMNLRVPAITPAASRVPVVVRVGDRVSNAATIAVR
jgi:uncharacterized protein (TIGR03437 family)